MKKRQDTVRTKTYYRVFCISKFITRHVIIEKVLAKRDFLNLFISHEIILEREKIMQFFN